MRAWRASVLLALGGMLPFCSSSEKDSGCISGQQIACACPGNARGVQVCQSDGKGYGRCEQCRESDGSAGASGRGGGSGSAGASGSGSAGEGGSAGASGSAGESGSAGASGSAGESGSAGANGSAGRDGSAGTSGSAGRDGGAGTGGAAGDAGASCPAGSVTDAVNGTCDLLRQNCASPLTCTIQQAGAAWRTECATLGAGTKALGATCASHSECAVGLRCTSNKCTRPCCPQREAEFCGTGQCDLTLGFSSTGAGYLTVCSFSPPCTPWANNCPPGPERDCHVAPGNRFLCDAPNYNLDAGSTVGRSCFYRNDCGDSQYCTFSGADASTGICRWLCKASPTGAPDAGTVGGAPGQGGCPGGTTCRPFSNPTWLGVCLPP